MPICPKCHKEISASHYERHLRRCGTSHKHVTGELYVPSATPAWERPDRGILVGPSGRGFGRKPRWLRLLAWAVVALLLLGGAITIIGLIFGFI